MARSGNGKWVMLQKPGVNTATIGVLLMLAVHLVIVFTGGVVVDEGLRSEYLLLGLSWDGVASGQLWQLFTYFWLHGNWSHLALNTILFYYAAARLSHVLSGWRIFVLFLATSVGAGMVHVAAQAAFPGLVRMPLVGASGGVMGMLLAYFALSPGSRMLLLPVSANNLAKGTLIASALLFIMTPSLGLPLMADCGRWLSSAFGEGLFQIGHLLHFAGGLLGWVSIPKFFPKLLTLEDLVKMRSQSELVS